MDTRKTYTAIVRRDGTLFRYPYPRDGDRVGLVGLQVTTSSPQPPLDELLCDLGRLQITVGAHTVCTIPVTLLAAIGNCIEYGPRHLALAFDFDAFVGDLPMSAIVWDTPFVDLHVGSRAHVRSVRFVFRRHRCGLAALRRMVAHAHVQRVQQILTQSRWNQTPSCQFVFPLRLTRPTKGFLFARADEPQTVYLIDGEGERRLEAPVPLGSQMDAPFVFVRIGVETVAVTDTWSEGEYCNDRETVYIKVRYAAPRSSATLHCLTANELVIRNGMVSMGTPVTHGQIADALNPVMWEDISKNLPADAECPITYAPIGPTYYECADCTYAFDAIAFRRYAATAATTALTCPMCRRTWSRYVQYHRDANMTDVEVVQTVRGSTNPNNDVPL